MTDSKKVCFHTEYVKLDSFLKLACACATGGEAKMAVQSGDVFVNGEPCLQRGKKIHDKDVVVLDGQKYLACREG